MTIYTSASRTHKPEHGICERGIEQTKRVLEKLGLTMESLVTMRTILEEMGISDCVYSFCEVRKGCEEEADFVLRAYMGYIVVLTQEYLGVYLYSHGLTKRLLGIKRAALLVKDHKDVCELYRHEADPARRYGIEVYKCLLSDKTDSQVATHAGVALMDGAEILGKRNEVHDKLKERLRELLT